MSKLSVDIFIPVHNNGEEIEKSITEQVEFYTKHLQSYDWKIIIADNASTDNTKIIASALSKKYKNVEHTFTHLKGRGNALALNWRKSNADIVTYMDVDLATKLDAFPKLINAIAHGSDIAIGSRYVAGSQSQRSVKRFFLSKALNLLLKITLGVRFSDAQCGFKGAKSEVAKEIIPHIKNTNWFWDAEFLYVAEKAGYGIIEVPICWSEGSKSGVKAFKTVFEFLKGIMRMKLTKIVVHND